MDKTLILIRHGHRDTSRCELDNGLDEKGREQAKNARRFFSSRFAAKDLKSGIWVVSSPKLRCVETLQPLAKALDREVDIHPGLDEQGLREPHGSFEARIEAFVKEWEMSKSQVTVVSSHGDYLPLMVHRLLGLYLELKKGSWLELEGNAGHFSLKWYIPSFKPLFE